MRLSFKILNVVLTGTIDEIIKHKTLIYVCDTYVFVIQDVSFFYTKFDES